MANVEFRVMFKRVYFIIINTFIIISPLPPPSLRKLLLRCGVNNNNAGASFTATYRRAPNMTRHNKYKNSSCTFVCAAFYHKVFYYFLKVLYWRDKLKEQFKQIKHVYNWYVTEQNRKTFCNCTPKTVSSESMLTSSQLCLSPYFRNPLQIEWFYFYCYVYIL